MSTVEAHSKPQPWVERCAADISARAERELEALVAVSSPSGDLAGAEEAVSVISALLPPEVEITRPGCSSPGYAPDLEVRMRGDGRGRLLLLGHFDTVVPHERHRRIERDGERLVGSGSVDMKGGVVLSLGVLRALAQTPAAYEEAALLVVADEEWRTAPFIPVERFTDYDACLCFEAGELVRSGDRAVGEGVIVRRKAAGSVRVRARGVSSHSGAAPDDGRNALLALAAVAQSVASNHDPQGPQRLTAVPTILHAGTGLNVVPGDGELTCDLRADSLGAFEPVLESIPAELDGVELEAAIMRRWPGMDAREVTSELLESAAARLGRPVIGVERGGASDASHMATAIDLVVDGLGPRGGGAHAPDEFVLDRSLAERAEVALALTAAVLEIE